MSKVALDVRRPLGLATFKQVLLYRFVTADDEIMRVFIPDPELMNTRYLHWTGRNLKGILLQEKA